MAVYPTSNLSTTTKTTSKSIHARSATLRSLFSFFLNSIRRMKRLSKRKQTQHTIRELLSREKNWFSFIWCRIAPSKLVYFVHLCFWWMKQKEQRIRQRWVEMAFLKYSNFPRMRSPSIDIEIVQLGSWLLFRECAKRKVLHTHDKCHSRTHTCGAPLDVELRISSTSNLNHNFPNWLSCESTLNYRKW